MSDLPHNAFPPHIPPGLAARYRVFTILLVATVFTCCFGGPFWLFRHLTGDSTLVTIRGPNQRTVAVKYPNLQEVSQFFSVGVYERGIHVGGTGINVSMDQHVSRGDFRAVWLDEGDTVAVFSKHTVHQDDGPWTPILAYRFPSGELFDNDNRMPLDLALRAVRQFRHEHADINDVYDPTTPK